MPYMPRFSRDRDTPRDDKEWKIRKIVVGVHVNAVVLILALLGSDNLDPEQLSRLEDKTIRRLGQGQIDEKGQDVSGYIVISDAGAALFYGHAQSREWTRNHNRVNTSRAPSLTYINSGNSRGGKIAVANSKDITSLLMTHKKMIHANINLISTVQKKRKHEEKDISHSDQSPKLRMSVVSDKYNSYWARKEIMVQHAIDANFEGFMHNQVISNSQGHLKRVDHLKLINGTYLAIETDEMSHDPYDKQKDRNRTNEFHTIHGKRWIWIRFNPDSNREEDEKKTSIEHKITVLIAAISRQEQRINNFQNNTSEMAEYEFLFY